VPVHPDVAARFHYLDGLRSLGEAYSDPVLIRQIRQFETWEPAQAPPAVHTSDESAPGPHGPVPVRIYTPSADVPTDAPCLVWLHGGGFIGGDLDMRPGRPVTGVTPDGYGVAPCQEPLPRLVTENDLEN
jgi:acetyl esterase